jgi:Mor family transcriptional regulator
LGNDALSHGLLANIGKKQARERRPQAMGQLTGESFYLDVDAGGKRAGRAPKLFLEAR